MKVGASDRAGQDEKHRKPHVGRPSARSTPAMTTRRPAASGDQPDTITPTPATSLLRPRAIADRRLATLCRAPIERATLLEQLVEVSVRRSEVEVAEPCVGRDLVVELDP